MKRNKDILWENCTYLFKNTDCVFFDVDDTLIMWGEIKTPLNSNKFIRIKDPHLSHAIEVLPHTTHINILKRNFKQGRKVVVWSAGGWEWANTVVKKLKLIKYVTLIMSKPTLIVDDLEMVDWNTRRLYFKDDVEGR